MAELRPFTIHDETARYWSRRLSWLSSLIGYGLIVAVPIISNQVNVQIGALANVIIMLCMTVWALYLDFRNKRDHPAFAQLWSIRWPFSACLRRLCAGVRHWLASAYFIVLFSFVVRSGQQPEIYDGATVRSPAIIGGIAAFVSGMFSRWLAKPSPSRHILSVTIQNCKTAEWLAFGGAENGAYSDRLRGGNVVVERMGLFDFWNWLQNGGAENRRYPDPYRTHSFFSAVGWTVCRQFDRNRLVSDIHGRPLPSARMNPADAVP